MRFTGRLKEPVADYHSGKLTILFEYLRHVFRSDFQEILFYGDDKDTCEDRYPTILNTGRPLLTSASTLTGTQSTPQMAADITLLNIQILLSPAAGQRYPSQCGHRPSSFFIQILHLGINGGITGKEMREPAF